MVHPYVPINCEFHDVLEDIATRRRTITVVYLDDDGLCHEVRTTIEDIGAREGAEFMCVSGGLNIRMDRIVSVDGISLAGFQSP